MKTFLIFFLSSFFFSTTRSFFYYQAIVDDGNNEYALDDCFHIIKFSGRLGVNLIFSEDTLKANKDYYFKYVIEGPTKPECTFIERFGFVYYLLEQVNYDTINDDFLKLSNEDGIIYITLTDHLYLDKDGQYADYKRTISPVLTNGNKLYIYHKILPNNTSLLSYEFYYRPTISSDNPSNDTASTVVISIYFILLFLSGIFIGVLVIILLSIKFKDNRRAKIVALNSLTSSPDSSRPVSRSPTTIDK